MKNCGSHRPRAPVSVGYNAYLIVSVQGVPLAAGVIPHKMVLENIQSTTVCTDVRRPESRPNEGLKVIYIVMTEPRSRQSETFI